MSFDSERKKFLLAFNTYSSNYFSKKKSLSKFPEVKRFYSDLEEFIAGGKKLRAFLVYLGWRIAGKSDIKAILPAALGVELLHAFMLIHDDVMDRADLRHSKPTIHKLYAKLAGEHFGNSMAILAGDLAAFEAVELVRETGSNEALALFITTTINTVYGQTLDLSAVISSYNLRKLETVIDLKTSWYTFIGPLLLGITIGKQSDEKIKNTVVKFGLALGEAFQLRDDLMGVFAQEKKVGKSVLSDMREGKNTILVNIAKQKASAGGREILEKLWGKQDAVFTDLVKVRKIISTSGAYDACVKQMDEKKQEAKSYIAGFCANSKLALIVVQMADFVVERSS